MLVNYLIIVKVLIITLQHVYNIIGIIICLYFIRSMNSICVPLSFKMVIH